MQSGDRLGPYEIVAPLGAGGMGEVYRARDTRLEREVAIKVLPEHLSSNPELRQRLEREARAVSSLSHPHICALYDIGNQEGIDFLVMEYLEGETLAQRLEKGPLPMEQVLRYGAQIADALEKAHRQGIVHRDLKPGNVMLTRSGVKLLDFGLAKLGAAAVEMERSGLSRLATAAQPATPLTERGTILGTYHYMAPEQLEGKEADARSDLFALGALLYEMATGRKAFQGHSQASLIAAIMGSEPPAVTALQPMTPPALDHVIRRCLAKDPDDRWQSAQDVASQLDWIAEGGSVAGLPAPVAARRRNRERLAWTAAGLALLLAGSLAVGHLRRSPAPPRLLRTSILLPKERFLTFASISPDASRLAFVAAAADGTSQLWVRPLDSLTPRPLPGTEGATFPFWSPDGRAIGFFADGKLKRIDPAGGPPVTLHDVGTDGLGGTWSRDGVILFGALSVPIQRLPAAGGTPTPVTELDESRGETTHRYPQFLPDGRRFLYLAANLAGAPDDPANLVRVADLDGGDDRPVMPASSNTVYADGHLLFARDGNLLAQPFDLKSLRTTGPVLPVAERITQPFEFWAYVPFSASATGALFYAPEAAAPSRLVWLDRAGREVGRVGEPAFYGWPRISPDGRRLAVTIRDPGGTSDIWLYDLQREVRSRFTTGPGNNVRPVWSPDGEAILYSSDRKHQADLYLKATGGGGAEEVFLEGEGQRLGDDWSPDGRWIAFENREPKGQRRVSLSIVPASGSGEATIFFQRGGNSEDASFSPDGRWIAYTSEESGTNEVYVAAFPGTGRRWQVSTAGGFGPRWRADGRELFYIAADISMMSVPVEPGAALEIGSPVKLFQVPAAGGFDVSADGERFLVVAAGAESSPPAVLVQSWTAGLSP